MLHSTAIRGAVCNNAPYEAYKIMGNKHMGDFPITYRAINENADVYIIGYSST
jgi:hypothetical protein